MTALPDSSADDGLPSAHVFLAFFVIALASSTVSEGLRRWFRLPLITGYILGGILCGPHMLGFVTSTECLDLAKLVTADAMGFIGFSAGSKFLLSELQGSLRQVLSLSPGWSSSPTPLSSLDCALHHLGWTSPPTPRKRASSRSPS